MISQIAGVESLEPDLSGLSTPARAALRYYGGKWKLAPWILSHFPSHTTYVEPFAGAASVLLRKAPAKFEVLNDADSSVVNFFRVLREYPAEFQRQIALTPFARAELDLACLPSTDDPSAGLSDMERARRFYIRSWQSIHGAPARGRMGWRPEKGNSRAWTRTNVDAWGLTEHLAAIAERLKGVQIECDDAFKVLSRYDTPHTLFYVDPPYPAATRGARWATSGYAHELTDAGHRWLADALKALKGMVVLSGYDCELYAELYPDWRRVSRSHQIQSRAQAEECLWLSPAATTARDPE